jgi:hypothetical protein
VARFFGGTETHTCPATSSETLSETYPRVCQHCGSPERDWDPVQLCAIGGETMLLHKQCQDELKIEEFTAECARLWPGAKKG